MSSRWFIRTQQDLSNSPRGASEHSNDSAQPLTFEQLAQLLADGVIEDSDLVKPETGMDWQPVETVIGLRRVAEKLQNSQRQHPEFHVDAAAETESDAIAIPHAALAVEPGPAEVPPASAVRSGISKPVSWFRVLLLSASIGGAAWGCWSYWNESRRFPRPAHLTGNPEPWILPGIGPVSGFEAMLLAVDAIAIAVFLLWWLRAKRWWP